jgi:hypothetical protein
MLMLLLVFTLLTEVEVWAYCTLIANAVDRAIATITDVVGVEYNRLWLLCWEIREDASDFFPHNFADLLSLSCVSVFAVRAVSSGLLSSRPISAMASSESFDPALDIGSILVYDISELANELREEFFLLLLLLLLWLFLLLLLRYFRTGSYSLTDVAFLVGDLVEVCAHIAAPQQLLFDHWV